ncbi:phage tail sheath subtilisin-like domain-containing protein [Rheinheimera sp. UJ51]|uniref:phage tail sheath family protein n=1 Tax=Rheinheimera sp. UJ51 TaxID=2892446 RepID=UPI001E573199|nr:phage tail sheath subtilisin-like domain-containing protein [Rheinheimera sp. UJ51]MCC5453109.1 phage tail sheath subtilisin-like domain-containing protein [Rheinheimera sp. UJ51]
MQQTGIATPIVAVSTATVLFIGRTEYGIVAKPILIDSLAQYRQLFQTPQKDLPGHGKLHDSKLASAMNQAVMTFYANNGNKAYICPVADDDLQPLYQKVLTAYVDFSLIVLPGLYWSGTKHSAANEAIKTSLAFCQQSRRCILLLDIAPTVQLHSAADVAALQLPSSSYAVLYYPWLTMPDPSYQPRTKSGVLPALIVPPSAAAAAIYGTMDSKNGVWKAPAGTTAKLYDACNLRLPISNTLLQQLNPLGINCLRALPKADTVLWGGRTLASAAEPEWRYLSVRRTAIFIEQSILHNLEWAHAVENSEPLWQAVRSNVEQFLLSLFQAGAMKGTVPKEAFFVRCGLGQTMTVQDILQQQLILLCGVALLKPAEFVILRLVYPLSVP